VIFASENMTLPFHRLPAQLKCGIHLVEILPNKTILMADAKAPGASRNPFALPKISARLEQTAVQQTMLRTTPCPKYQSKGYRRPRIYAGEPASQLLVLLC
jgi:hypothetical protein